MLCWVGPTTCSSVVCGLGAREASLPTRAGTRHSAKHAHVLRQSWSILCEVRRARAAESVDLSVLPGAAADDDRERLIAAQRARGRDSLGAHGAWRTLAFRRTDSLGRGTRR